MKIAVAGKGGVGKTFIAGTLACTYAAKGLKTIAIDADTSPNLALTLGMTPEDAARILPIAENQQLIDEKTKTDYPGVFKLSYTVDDIVSSQAVPTPCGVQLLVMGMVRAMGAGCACPAHNLVRTLTSHLFVERKEVLIMDMEAGVEHLGRGTAKNVDILLIITDAHQASLVTAERIVNLAWPAGIPKIAYVANKVTNTDVKARIYESASNHNVPVLGCIPHDQDILTSGMLGKPVTTEAGYKAVAAVRTLAETLEQNFLSN
ncbi:MAG: AAA family ATPase [Methanospirillum sp.]|uniref:ATP-binding protein n=1 Tax=Methanospirillum sp. TaxID=45200 RepID=UPI00236AAA80|nr:AAA family ATPase [Methanospirillum sp.]MDD1728352.1 AAA family ATPase [Methanospirillum sp.]